MVEAGMCAVTMWACYYVCSGSTRRLVVGCVVLATALTLIMVCAYHGMDMSMGAAARGMQ